VLDWGSQVEGLIARLVIRLTGAVNLSPPRKEFRRFRAQIGSWKTTFALAITRSRNSSSACAGSDTIAASPKSPLRTLDSNAVNRGGAEWRKLLNSLDLDSSP
jgi:hypothetical protein